MYLYFLCICYSSLLQALSITETKTHTPGCGLPCKHKETGGKLSTFYPVPSLKLLSSPTETVPSPNPAALFSLPCVSTPLCFSASARMQINTVGERDRPAGNTCYILYLNPSDSQYYYCYSFIYVCSLLFRFSDYLYSDTTPVSPLCIDTN